jgi:hypothetical protein
MQDEIRSIMRDYLPLSGGAAAAEGDLRETLLPQQDGKRGGGAGGGGDVEGGGGGEPRTPAAGGWASRRRAAAVARALSLVHLLACQIAASAGLQQRHVALLGARPQACRALPSLRAARRQVCLPASPDRADRCADPAHPQPPGVRAWAGVHQWSVPTPAAWPPARKQQLFWGLQESACGAAHPGGQKLEKKDAISLSAEARE